MHSILTGDARVLTEWAAGLEPLAQATFFNFTASHDGVGVRPAEGLLSDAEIQALADAAVAHGGRVSFKSNADGSRSVYELNISYFDALSDPSADEPVDVQVARFMVSQAIMLSLAGVPGIYVHSLLGSRSWQEGVAQTGRNRTINREKFNRAILEQELRAPSSLRHKVFAAYSALLRTRAATAAFHPFGEQQVLSLNPSVFAVLRIAPQGDSRALCLHNVSDRPQRVQFIESVLGGVSPAWRDLVSGEGFAPTDDGSSVELPPYAVLWLGA
jgi:glycosidase